jgi:hypothetical protein
LKSFQTGHICEKFSPKGPTSKKVGLNSSMATTHVIENNIANTPYFYCSYSILSWRTRKEKHHEIMYFLALFSFHFSHFLPPPPSLISSNSKWRKNSMREYMLSLER